MRVNFGLAGCKSLPFLHGFEDLRAFRSCCHAKTNGADASMSIPSGSEERQMTERESEQRIVLTTPGNAGRGKALSPARDLTDPSTIRSDGASVHDRLGYIHERAQQQPAADFSNVFHLMKYELLWHAYRKLKLNKAPGVNGVSVEDYEANLRDNLRDLESRLQRGAYRPQPSLRREIPKGDPRKGKTRPLGAP